MKYLCEVCKFNNNGWCRIKKKNGLKKMNIQKCADFENENSTLSNDLEKYSTEELLEEIKRRCKE